MIMRTFICSMLIMSIGLTSCTSVHYIMREESSYQMLSKKIEKKSASIVLMNEQTTSGKDIRVTLDSTSWIDSTLKMEQNVPTNEVKEIIVESSRKGALQGLGLGTVGGIVLGLLLATREHVESEEEPGLAALGNLAASVIYAIGGGLVGGLTGFIIGSNKGSKDTYVINTQTK